MIRTWGWLFASIIAVGLLPALCNWNSGTAHAADAEVVSIHSSEDSLLIQEALRIAPMSADYYTVRQVLRGDAEDAECIVWLSTGGRTGNGFIVATTPSGEVVSKVETKAIRDVRMVELPGLGRMVLSREVTGSGTGYHQETLIVRDGNNLHQRLWEKPVREIEVGPYPNTKRCIRIVQIQELLLTEIEFVEQGQQLENGDILWGEPQISVQHYAYDREQASFAIVQDEQIQTRVISWP